MVVNPFAPSRGARTKVALVDAARQRFGINGFGATLLDDVVADAGVTKGALYHHFADKEALFRAVVDEVKRETTEPLSEWFLHPDPWVGLVGGCHAILEAYLDPAVRQIVLVDSLAVLGPVAYRELQNRYEPVFLRAVLRRGMRLGIIDTQPLLPLAALLTGGIQESCLLVAQANNPAAAKTEVLAVLTRLLEGLRTPAG
ncbi:MAG: TetR/AcrR family transcriptional regulator [Acidimicrobiales bacterium]